MILKILKSGSQIGTLTNVNITDQKGSKIVTGNWEGVSPLDTPADQTIPFELVSDDGKIRVRGAWVKSLSGNDNAAVKFQGL